MKKRLFAIVLAVMLLVVSTAPVLAHRVGDPPGWSQVNPGQGGSHGPGNG